MPIDKPNYINPDLGKIEEEQQANTHNSDKLNDQEDNPLTAIERDETEGKTATSSGSHKSSEHSINAELGEIEEAQQIESLNEGEGSILLSGFDENE